MTLVDDAIQLHSVFHANQKNLLEYYNTTE